MVETRKAEVVIKEGSFQDRTESRKATVRRGLSRTWDQFVVPCSLIALVVVLSLLNRYFLTVGNLMNVLHQLSILAIVSAGMTFVIVCGGFDLSVGSVVALTGSLAALVMMRWGILVGILSGLLAGTAIGLVNGTLISRVRISPFIATLGMQVIARGLALGVTGGSAVFGLPASYSWLGNGHLWIFPVPAVMAFLVFLGGWLVLQHTAFGLRVYAVGGNREAARLSGINVERVITMSYLICGACAGFAGLILSARLQAGEPTAAVFLELFAIAAVVLGGASLQGGEGFISRTMIGVLFIGFLQNGLNLMNVPYYWQQVVIGSVFAGAASLGALKKSR